MKNFSDIFENLELDLEENPGCDKCKKDICDNKKESCGTDCVGSCPEGEPKNNDGRKTCYWCGGPTEKDQYFLKSVDICRKCGK